MVRNILFLSAIFLLAITLHGCSDDSSSPVVPPSFSYNIDGMAVKGIVISGDVTVLDAAGSPVGQTTQTDENGRFQLSFTSDTQLELPFQVAISGAGAQSVCDVYPICEVGGDVVVGFGEVYDLPDDFEMRAAIQSVESPGEDTFQATAYISPLSEFVTAAALSIGDGQSLTTANLDVANETIANLLLDIFPTLPVPAVLDVARVPLLDLTDLQGVDIEALNELSIAATVVSATVASFVESGSSSRGDIAQVITDFSEQINAGVESGGEVLDETDGALLAQDSLESMDNLIDDLNEAIVGDVLSLPEDLSLDDLNSLQQQGEAELPEIVDIWTNLTPGEQTADVQSRATGWADLVILPETGEARLILETEGIDATQAHLHGGFGGTNGAVLVEFVQDPLNNRLWYLPEGTVLEPDVIAAILAGGTYYNVHSEAYPAGELRGQVLPENIDMIVATPKGIEEVPEPLESAGFARGAVTLDRDTNIAQVHFTSDNIEPGAAHIHEGVAGTNGPVVIEMMQDSLNAAHWSAEDVELSAGLLDALDTARLYFNLHTAANPGGELRGQVVPDGFKLIISELEPGQVVSSTTVDSTASGVSALTLEMSSRDFSIHLNTTDIVDPTAAHIHAGAEGENGGILHELTRDSLNDRHWLLESASFSDDELMMFLDGALYAQVHTAAYAGGEIRGQLVDATLDSDGDGVPDVDDAFPEDPAETVDTDGDGVGDNGDAFPEDPDETVDSDGDGVGDNADAFPLNAAETTDTDGDGVGDNGDDCPNDPAGAIDSNGDGVCDSNDTGVGQDSDGDGVPDVDDAFPNDSSETTDTDGDGVGDNADAFPEDSTETTDTDGDGVGDNADAFPNDSTETEDSDGDGVGDNADAFPLDETETIDSDGDGVGNNADNCPNTANADQVDSNGDGTGDACEGGPAFSEVQAIFNANCVGCHGTSGGLTLEASVSHGNLVNVPSVGVPSVDRVEPGDSENSYIIWKLEGRSGIVGSRMPLGQAPLSNTDIQTIRDWIDAGANP